MSTRKLILWSLVCGVLILVAGSVKLFQSAESVDVAARLLERGQVTEIGGMKVSVVSVEVTSDRTLVTVTIGGVDGVDATEGWKLLAGGEASEPVVGSGRPMVHDDDGRGAAVCRGLPAVEWHACGVLLPRG